DRSLSAHLLPLSDLDRLAECAEAFARAGTAGLGASGLPAPLALSARFIDETQDPLERARALIDLVALTWKLLAFALMASARSVHARGGFHDPPECGPMPAPWRTLVREATRRFDGQPARIAELASLAAALDRDGAPGAAMKVIAGLTELITGPRPDRPT